MKSFLGSLLIWLKPEVAKINSKTAGRCIVILTKLVNANISCRADIISTQRVVFDCLYYKKLKEVITSVCILFSVFAHNEIDDLILNFLLRLLFPPTIPFVQPILQELLFSNSNLVERVKNKENWKILQSKLLIEQNDFFDIFVPTQKRFFSKKIENIDDKISTLFLQLLGQYPKK